MKNRLIHIFLLILIVSSISNINCVAQNTVNIYGSRSNTLSLRSSYMAGKTPEALKDDSKWLNYTILLNENEPPYSISAQIIGGTLPDGVKIRLKADYYIGPGEGNIGIPTGEILLSNIPQAIIENIGTSHTGSSALVGHRLYYTIDIEDFSKVEADLSALQIIFTLRQ